MQQLRLRKAVLFDHLISEQLHRAWGREPERLGGLEIDDQLEFGRLLDRQIGRLVALENPPGIDARPAKGIRNVVAVTDQAAVRRILTKSINRRNRMACRERYDLIAAAEKKSACADDERTGPLPRKARKCRVDVTRRAGIQHKKLQPKSTRGRLHLAHNAASGTFRSTSRAMTAALGTSSCSSESWFGTKSDPNQLTPVMLSPGRLRVGHESQFDGILADEEDDGNGRRRETPANHIVVVASPITLQVPPALATATMDAKRPMFTFSE
jgi:hypothetical protein